MDVRHVRDEQAFELARELGDAHAPRCDVEPTGLDDECVDSKERAGSGGAGSQDLSAFQQPARTIAGGRAPQRALRTRRTNARMAAVMTGRFVFATALEVKIMAQDEGCHPRSYFVFPRRKTLITPL